MSRFTLSEKWAEYLSNQPETGMGYQIVSVVLKDGKRFDRVTIVGGVVAGIYNQDTIPFKEEDIAKITVTHDKWDFQTGREIGERPHP